MPRESTIISADISAPFSDRKSVHRRLIIFGAGTSCRLAEVTNMIILRPSWTRNFFRIPTRPTFNLSAVPFCSVPCVVATSMVNTLYIKYSLFDSN